MIHDPGSSLYRASHTPSPLTIGARVILSPFDCFGPDMATIISGRAAIRAESVGSFVSVLPLVRWLRNVGGSKRLAPTCKHRHAHLLLPGASFEATRAKRNRLSLSRSRTETATRATSYVQFALNNQLVTPKYDLRATSTRNTDLSLTRSACALLQYRGCLAASAQPPSVCIRPTPRIRHGYAMILIRSSR